MTAASMPMDNSQFHSLVARQRAELGVFSEMLAAAKFARAGYAVSKPLNGTQSGYDLIVDDGASLLRVQVKTLSSQGQASIGFRKRTMEYATGTARFVDVPKYKSGDFDVLAAVDRDTLEVLLVLVGDIDLSKSSISVRSVRNVSL